MTTSSYPAASYTVTPEMLAERNTNAARAARISRKEVADLLPQAVITATVADGDYTLTAELAGGAEVTATYPGWHDGADRRADARKFIRRVIKHHADAGVQLAYTKRRTRYGFWVRVDSCDPFGPDSAGNAAAKDYVTKMGLWNRAHWSDVEKVGARSWVHKFTLGD